MIKRIEHRGVYIHECPLVGETRAQGVVPAHPHGTPLSADRWLILYATRGFRGIDDDRSIIYEVRADRPDGPVLREGRLAQASDDWRPLPHGEPYVKQLGHPTVFGVPKGATIDGRVPPHANVFVAKWRVTPRVLDRERNCLSWGEAATPPVAHVQWVQFRLNDTGDDIVLLHEPRSFCQKGYTSDDLAFCCHESVRTMNQGFVQPVPLNREASEWVEIAAIGGLAPVKIAFNAGRGVYEWVETGPYLAQPEGVRLTEASVAPCGDDWLIACRTVGGPGRGVAWFRCADPFQDAGEPVLSASIQTEVPASMYRGPDDTIRLFTTDAAASPSKQRCCRLYVWDIDAADGFAGHNRQIVFDSVKTGLPLPLEDSPGADMAQLLAHASGRTGYLLHRVCSNASWHPHVDDTPNVLSPEQFDACAIYYAQVEYDEEYPGAWSFAEM